ncbi:MAG: TonB family protein [Hyphomonadaceae bacterium]|nr:TonB family protein [Hyphomonadaceae bacterium]
MSEDPVRGASKIRSTHKGGGGGKWLIAAAAAALLIGGGYYVWQNMAPAQNNAQLAYTDTYADDYPRAAPLAPGAATTAESADIEADPASATSAPASAQPRAATPARRTPAPSTAAVPEQTIGVTPASVEAQNDDEIIVPAPRRPIWASTPTPRRLSAFYPANQLERGREGEARLSCMVENGGTLDCERVEETPGFGNAALRVARAFRHAPTLADGSNAAGTPVNLRVVFRIAEEPAHRSARLRG